MIPAAGDFELIRNPNGADLSCPACSESIPVYFGWSMKQILTAASLHAKEHAKSERYGYVCSIQETNY